jgi:hypothetical protein
MKEMVKQFLVHYGYVETLQALEDDSDNVESSTQVEKSSLTNIEESKLESKSGKADTEVND